ncbi:MAG: hypothetical protein JRN06_00330 [Nitrososphaerota archaeon]|nr:hypothetical protein [Nitrososphaerota archaeon]MDG7023701.1 hypothetical protein [Nitrososphaerota archaeon]
MGNSFENDLDLLSSTYRWAKKANLGDLPDFFSRTFGNPLLVVGSGGSFTTASFIAMLARASGVPATPTTPLGLASWKAVLRRASVALISAKGRNPDVVGALQFSIAREAREILVLCGAAESDLVSRANKSGWVTTWAMNLPHRDGFLATNSVLAFSILCARTFSSLEDQKLVLPEDLESLLSSSKMRQPIIDTQTSLAAFRRAKSFLLLYGGWSEPAAYDFESKMIEGALGSVSISDYRNFSHGRHNWLWKSVDSAVLALITPETGQIADSTVASFPRRVPRATVSTMLSGPLGSIELIVRTMRLVNEISVAKQIDLNHPRIPAPSRRLYWTNYHKFYGEEAELPAAIERKLQSGGPFLQVDLAILKSRYSTFLHSLARARFGGLVLDYDGTLCPRSNRFGDLPESISTRLASILDSGVCVGIASGRGKSLRKALRSALPRRLWPKLAVGYYNGSVISRLDQDNQIGNLPTSKSLVQFMRILSTRKGGQELSNPEARGEQLTFMASNHGTHMYLLNALMAAVHSSGVPDLHVLESSHSIDVLTAKASKLSVIREVKKVARSLELPDEVLVIGDMGQWPGNDWEMLAESNALSVDQVSQNPETCWNLAPRGMRGPPVTLRYLEALRISANGSFAVRINRRQKESDAG